MNNDITTRILGGLYIAVTAAMPQEVADLAHEVLFRFADNPDVRPEDRFIYKTIADAASRPIDELAAENEQFENERPRFSVIEGGNNAA